jgi:murein DD-endopeptidase MepM/ murein hydrolase activator NlpD
MSSDLPRVTGPVNNDTADPGGAALVATAPVVYRYSPRMARQKRSGRLRGCAVLLLLLFVAFLGLGAFRAGPPPTIEAAADLPGIGKRTTVRVRVAEPRRGLAGVKVELVQGDRVEPLTAETHEPRAFWQLFWGPRRTESELSVEVGTDKIKGLKEGPATVRVSAERAPAWLRRPGPAVHELTLPVKLRPPALHVLSTATYVAQGGCEAVVYRVGESSVRDGVRVGEWWFPGYPRPQGGPGERFALFAAPFDLPGPASIRLVAEDDVGNAASVAFVDRFIERPFKTDTIEVSDAFMSRVVPAILSQTPSFEDRGDLLRNYLAINGELRQHNAATLTELAARTAQEFLWNRAFVSMPNAQVMSDFADRRTYVYNGRTVDRQDHLGFDLASTRMAEVPAANDGIVLLAGYFGIYGNAVVLDHGYGLMSLYGHLSSVAVAEGDRVARGQSVGRTGDTGLAGGDHLHFTMLLHGLAVNPREWWDGHWIHDRIGLKLGPALPFVE